MYVHRNYGPTIRTQLVAESKGHQQVLWLFGEDQQLTEVGTMNLFVHWINENGGRHKTKLLILSFAVVHLILT